MVLNWLAVCLLPLLSDLYLCEVIWAVNCGGGSHVDVNGIEYIADPIHVGTASDYGRSFTINRVPPEDQILYQTERYHTGDFSYDVPFVDDGSYVLTLKFSEVWFTDPDQKVFGVQLNKALNLLDDLDIFSQVGFATALEHHIPLTIADGVLQAAEQSVNVNGNAFTVDFIKSDRDNPKINAIVLTKGTIGDVPKLPEFEKIPDQPKPPPFPTDDHAEAETERKRPAGSPRAPDPYATMEYSYLMLPVLVSLAAVVPIVFCLCKI